MPASPAYEGRYATDLTFLALCIWREARGESREARRAVGYVIATRAVNPRWWGRSMKAVIFKPYQFSSITDARDKQLVTWPADTDEAWQDCCAIASQIMSDMPDLAQNPFPNADHYHDTSIDPPAWAKGEQAVGQIGKLVFYSLELNN